LDITGGEGDGLVVGEGWRNKKGPDFEEPGLMKRKRPSLCFKKDRPSVSDETKKTVPLFHLRFTRPDETKKTVPLFQMKRKRPSLCFT